jgi:predicted enzyme related to lactoylglutathione lyase
MTDRPDPFDALRRPVVPLAPRPAFVASLRRRLQEELNMAPTDDQTAGGAGAAGAAGAAQLVMVHLRVGNADRAMAFFGALLDWQGERVEFEDHVSYYTTNTETTVRMLDDPGAPAVVPNYGVADVGAVVQAIGAAGGQVTQGEPNPDGSGWARGTDDQGLPLLVFRPGRHYESAPPTREATGEVGLVFLREDAARAERFYGPVLGWQLSRSDPASHYFDAVPKVGIFDEAAAFGHEVEPDATLYLSVDALAPALARVEELGGQAGPGAQDMGPYFSARCTDDQGTEFGLIATTLEGPPDTS